MLVSLFTGGASLKTDHQTHKSSIHSHMFYRTYADDYETVPDCRKYRKYNLQRTLNYFGRDYTAEIGITHNCYCWFTCIDKNTPVMLGNAAYDYSLANGKWCYGRSVANEVDD